MTTKTRPRTISTAFLSDAKLANLTTRILVHRLDDGTRVRVRATGDTHSGYPIARVLDGPLTGKTVRLNDRTDLA